MNKDACPTLQLFLEVKGYPLNWTLITKYFLI